MAQCVLPFTATVGTTARTCVQLIATAAQQLEVRAFCVTFNGTSPTATSILVEVLVQTSAGTSVSATPNKWDQQGGAITTTGLDTFTSTDPTAGDILWRGYVLPQGGTEREFTSLDGPKGLTAGRIGIRVTGNSSTSGLTATGYLRVNDA